MSSGAAKLLVALIALIFLFVAEFTLYRIMERFATDSLADSRIPFARNTFIAAMEYMPFGSGMGSFVSVYGMYERPGDTMNNAFANHAHNDILEMSLEAGAFGIVLAGLFAFWLAKRSIAIWRRSTLGSRNLDLWLARSATIIVFLLAIHSSVDYPLRTAAMMAIAAFACGLLVAPSGGGDETTSSRRERRGGQSLEKPRRSLPVRAGAAPVATSMAAGGPPQGSGGGLPGKDITWPEVWHKGP
jgi:O-antigen ligase